MELFYWFLIVAFILFIIEVMTPGMFAFFSMAVATLITATLTFFVKDLSLLVLIDSVLSIVVFIIMKNMKMFKMPNTTITNTDRYIGQNVKVVSIIEEHKYRVKIYSEEWTGICQDTLAIGEDAEVLSIEGTTMKLKKI